MHLLKSFYPLKFVKSGQKGIIFTLWGFQGRFTWEAPSSITEFLDSGKKEALMQFYSKQAVINSLYSLNNPQLQVGLEN